MLRGSLVLFAAAGAVAAVSGWKRGARASGAKQLEVVIGIRHANPAGIEEALMRVSDPSSPHFGQHLSKEEVDALSAPRPESSVAVLLWAASHGVDGVRVSDAGDFLFGRASVATLEVMLGTTYFEYTRDGKTIVRCETVSLPQSIAPHVDLVSPTTRFPPASSLRVKSGNRAPMVAVTPAVIRSQYGIGSTEAKNAASQQAAAGFDEQYASPADLATFFSKFYTPAVGRDLNIVGPNNASFPGIEASLDVEYIMSIGGNGEACVHRLWHVMHERASCFSWVTAHVYVAFSVNSTYWYTAGTRPDENEPFLTWLLAIEALSDAQLPKVCGGGVPIARL
jgi:tripeptidyl-peptidase I